MRRIVVFVLLAFLIVAGASSWEGAAATSPDGELPANGLYVATNSFPRNTVVDIYNIETNKSTRAIVASGLNSPGLLAIVSREAAEIIGMRPGSISRIRLTQPSDPIAYLRFTEGLADGIPPYDSGNVITEETYRNDPRTPAGEGAQAIVSGSAPPYYLEPEWGGRSIRDIIDLPVAPIITGSSEPGIERISELPHEEEVQQEVAANVPEDNEAPQEIALVTGEEDEAPNEIAEYSPEEEEETPQEIAAVSEEETPQQIAASTESETPQQIAALPEEETPQQVAALTKEEVPQQIAAITEEETPQQVAVLPKEEAPQQVAVNEQIEAGQVAQYNLVPAQERPPEGTIYGINPADIIPQITRTSEPERPPVLEPVIESISAIERGPFVENIPSTGNIPLTENTLITEKPVNDTNFSVPRIYELIRGSYYVQLAAVDTPESVENAIKLIDRNYGPVVYKDGDNWYRILLGPLNQGESAAVLQRFKSIGYRDAFIRQSR